jgi:transcriptional regulator GlxA family with amidase domain
MADGAQYVIGIPVYNGVDLLDVAVPYELFNWMAKLEPAVNRAAPQRVVRLLSADGPSVTTRDGLPLGADLGSLRGAAKVDLLWVPGAEPPQLEALMQNDEVCSALRRLSGAADYTVSVCEGALLLAAAGLLDGYRATTHWAFRACLGLFPQVTVVQGYPRFEHDRNRITGGGISSGLDEALYIIGLLAGEVVAKMVQLNIQYKPLPPFDSGDPSVARPPVYTPGQDSTCAIADMAATIAQVLARRASK